MQDCTGCAKLIVAVKVGEYCASWKVKPSTCNYKLMGDNPQAGGEAVSAELAGCTAKPKNTDTESTVIRICNLLSSLKTDDPEAWNSIKTAMEGK